MSGSERTSGIPVSTEESAKATSVVDIISTGLSSPISAAIVEAMMWKNGCRPKDGLKWRGKGRQMVRKTYDDLDHHAPVGTCKSAPTKGVYQLSYNRTTPPTAFSMKEGGVVRGTYETKNIDTPIPPKPSKTPEAGNMIIPSDQKISASTSPEKQ